MTRETGIGEELATALDSAEPLLAVLTQLGDTWFLVALGVGLYWVGTDAPFSEWDRRRGVLVLGVVLWAVATTYVLKAAFALPRPPGAGVPTYAVEGPFGVIYEDAATGDGFGFPSGHATSTAAAYGTLAWLGSERGRRRHVAAGAVLVGVVSLTRVGLGVHYVADVAAGAGLGLLLAAVALRLRERPAAVLGLGVLTAGIALLESPADARFAALLGLVAGVFGAWWWLGRHDENSVAGPARGAVAFGVVLFVFAVPAVWVGALTASASLASLGGGLVVTALPAAIRR